MINIISKIYQMILFMKCFKYAYNHMYTTAKINKNTSIILDKFIIISNVEKGKI